MILLGDRQQAVPSPQPSPRAAISPEMALRIESWLGVDRGGRADLWLAEQAAYELWKARHASPSDRDQRSVQRAPEPQAV